jgi:hypothetical protein
MKYFFNIINEKEELIVQNGTYQLFWYVDENQILIPFPYEGTIVDGVAELPVGIDIPSEALNLCIIPSVSGYLSQRNNYSFRRKPITLPTDISIILRLKSTFIEKTASNLTATAYNYSTGKK